MTYQLHEDDSMMVLLVGVLMLSIGAGLLLACLDQRIAPYLHLKKCLSNWRAMLVEGPSQSPIVAGGRCSYETEPDHFHGYYYIDHGPTIGSAARIQVPLDFVARLGYADRWSKTRLLETSAFTLRTDDSGNAVEFLARGRRFCLDLNDNSVLANDGYVLNCQVAVHWYVDLALAEEPRFHLLFDNLPQLLATLHDGILGVLRTELTRRDYRQAMYEVPRVLSVLQNYWEQDSQFVRFRELVKIYFTGLIIRPREEAELRFLERLERGKAKIEEQIAEIDKEIRGTRANLFAEWHAIAMNREHAVAALHEKVPDAVRSQASSVKEIIVKQQTYEDAVAQSQRIFESATADLRKYSDNLMSTYAELGEFIQSLDRRSKQFLQNQPRSSSVP